MGYMKDLTDPRWQRVRLKILERDCWACRACNDASSTLHIHHLLYFSDTKPWDYPPFFLITLCETCHEDKILPPHALWTAMLEYKLETLEGYLDKPFTQKISRQIDCIHFLLEVA
jgi:hypothetical protein